MIQEGAAAAMRGGQEVSIPVAELREGDLIQFEGSWHQLTVCSRTRVSSVGPDERVRYRGKWYIVERMRDETYLIPCAGNTPCGDPKAEHCVGPVHPGIMVDVLDLKPAFVEAA